MLREARASAGGKTVWLDGGAQPAPQSGASRARVAAVIFSDLLREAALGPALELDALKRDAAGAQKQALFAIVMVSSLEEKQAQRDARIWMASPRAQKCGVRAGQTLEEARAHCSELVLYQVLRSAVEKLLLVAAEVACSMSPLVEIYIPKEWDEGVWRPPCIWLDITAVTQLFGGERSLLEELRERIRLLGHSVRVALADGPVAAYAMGVWGEVGPGGISWSAPGKVPEEMDKLPLCALPLGASDLNFFGKLGVISVRQLRALPRSSVLGRLGVRGAGIFSILDGEERRPLVPVVFEEVVEEELLLEEPRVELEPLFFGLRRLCSRLSARLFGRGVGAARVGLTFALESKEEAQSVLELPAPLWKESDLYAVIKARLERVILPGAWVGFRMQILATGSLQAHQEGLLNAELENAEKRELPRLLSELTASLGESGVGFLQIRSRHRPEERTGLELEVARKEAQAQLSSRASDRMTRIFHPPLPIPGVVEKGASLLLSRQLYQIESLRFVERLDGVEWWATAATSRDYLWAELVSGESRMDALIYIDKKTGHRFLQGVED
jgi:protein ImuB